MKIRTIILLVVQIMVFTSCDKRQNGQIITVTNPQENLAKTDQERIERRKQKEKGDQLDSLRISRVLEKALNVSYQNISLNSFATEFTSMPDSVFDMKTIIRIHPFFSGRYKHLIIRREGLANVYIDIYLIEGNKFNKVLSHSEWDMTYVSDTLKDVNGDGYKDFVLNGYGSSGNWLKAFSYVYLFRPRIGTFTAGYQFINPNFFPKEKIIMGVGYGEPGNTEMYKYIWNREAVDTLEYIYYEQNGQGIKTGKVIRSNKGPWQKGKRIIERLNSIPIEYKKIEGYDWFIGKW